MKAHRTGNKPILLNPTIKGSSKFQPQIVGDHITTMLEMADGSLSLSIYMIAQLMPQLKSMVEDAIPKLPKKLKFPATIFTPQRDPKDLDSLTTQFKIGRTNLLRILDYQAK